VKLAKPVARSIAFSFQHLLEKRFENFLEKLWAIPRFHHLQTPVLP